MPALPTPARRWAACSRGSCGLWQSLLANAWPHDRRPHHCRKWFPPLRSPRVERLFCAQGHGAGHRRPPFIRDPSGNARPGDARSTRQVGRRPGGRDARRVRHLHCWPNPALGSTDPIRQDLRRLNRLRLDRTRVSRSLFSACRTWSFAYCERPVEPARSMPLRAPPAKPGCRVRLDFRGRSRRSTGECRKQRHSARRAPFL